MKNKITAQFPQSRYAQIVNNSDANANSQNESPESVYNKWYQLFEKEQFALVLENIDPLITQYSGDEIVSKFELLKANTIGKLKGVTAYKNALQVVADNYPNREEGKNAQMIINDQIPLLEQLEFVTTESNSWKILYQVGSREDKSTKDLEERIKKFITSENLQKLSYSYDIYTDNSSFITIHGIKSKAYADDIALVLKDNAKFKIANPAIVIAAENYKVIQIKKNLDSYLALEKK